MHRFTSLLILLLAGLLAGASAAQTSPQSEPAAAVAAEPDLSAEPDLPPTPELPPLMLEARAIRAQLLALQQKFQGLSAEFEQAEGEDREVLERQIAKAKLEYLAMLSTLVENMQSQTKAGLEGAEVRAWLIAELPVISAAIVRHIEASEVLLRDLRKQRVSVDASEVDALEDRIEMQLDWMQQLLSGYLENLDELEVLGLDYQAAEADLRERLSTRADRLAGRIQLMVERTGNLEARVAQAPDDAALAAELRLTMRRKQMAVDAMSSTVAMMDRVRLDSTDYRQLLIRTTGEVTADVFRGRVALGLFEEWVEGVRTWFREAAPSFLVKAFFFVLILLAFRILAALTRRGVQRGIAGSAGNTSQLVKNMVLGLASRVVMLIGLLVALSQLGVELGPLLAGLGIAGFIVGFALQDSLSNFAAGIMILVYRPYDIGDVIEAGSVFGAVSTMSLVSTTVLTFDNQTLIVPNAKIWGDVIRNVTNQRQRRIDLEIHVAKHEDVEKTRKVLLDVLAAHPKVLTDPAPNVRLHKLQKSSLQFVVRPWVVTTDYWEVYWDLTEAIKQRFDREGIEIPDPKRDVRIVKGDAKT